MKKKMMILGMVLAIGSGLNAHANNIELTKSAYRTKSVCENPYNTRYLLVL